jgi:predicted RNA-binding protein associated with RNAse of E/G family
MASRLWLVGRGDAHMLGHFWDESWTFKGWYVNLRIPIVEHDDFVDSMDQALDVVVDPDGTCRWKDEDDLEKCVALTSSPRGSRRARVTHVDSDRGLEWG